MGPAWSGCTVPSLVLVSQTRSVTLSGSPKRYAPHWLCPCLVAVELPDITVSSMDEGNFRHTVS